MKRFLFATMVLAAMIGVWSCSDDDKDDDSKKDPQIVIPEGYTIWTDTATMNVDIKVMMLDKDGNNMLVPNSTYETNKYCQWAPGGWYSLFYAEYKGCHIYDLADGMGPKDEGPIHPQPHPDDFSYPEGFHGGLHLNGSSPNNYIEFGPIKSAGGSDETVVFHWSDGSADTVSYKIIRIPETYGYLYIGYYLNGQITKFPIELVKEF